MKDATLIFGPPGTGKTNTLLNLIDKYLKNGTEPNSIGFISFTKKSVNEAKERASLRFKKESDWFYYFRTIHALAFRQLGMSTSDVMNRKNYTELGSIAGLKITGVRRDEQQIYELSKGDQLVFLESLARLCCKSYKDMYDQTNPDFSWDEFDLFTRTFVNYKKTKLLYDFTDMLTKYYNEGYKPKLKVLFVDEAQDLCLLQWKIVEQLANNSEKTFIAGDDDQAIFRWSGAEIEFFINLTSKCKAVVLHKSYRLPKNVYNLSIEIIERISKRIKKEFKARDEKGEVNYITNINEINMSKGIWLILVRNIYMIEEIMDYLRSIGYLYESILDKPTKNDSLKAAFIWENLRAGKTASVSDIKLMCSFMSKNNLKGSISKALKDNENDFLTFTTLNNLVEITCQNKIWHEALDLMAIDDREYYIAARRMGESLLKNPRIKISTIHGAKGGESENVILYTDISKRTYDAMMNNYDDEARVFYVGITRTLKNLFIIQPQTPNYFTI
jgi:DNA helicase-2/ATP-dependent DNA helicase PcrA